MALWLVRGGRHGEQEQAALEHNVVAIGWNELPDLSNIKDKETLTKLYSSVYSQERPAAASIRVRQIWSFLKEIKKGDLVSLPLKSQSAIAIGRIEGDYGYKELTATIRHTRPVKWLKTIPRSENKREYWINSCDCRRKARKTISNFQYDRNITFVI